MCGVCGTIGPSVSVSRVEVMLEAMAHRGPDGTGSWSGEGVVLGHRRLAIVDLSDNGRQPMILPDRTLAATVNGEIYNYPQLRQELEQGGAVFASNCDSEVVLHAYRAWGTASFARFNGMFAFGLWDAQLRKLFVVRDRMGIKPVYYLRRGGDLYFASDIQALLVATGASSWEIDTCGLAQYLAFQNVFGERTLFAEVKSVRPGHYLECGATADVQHAYWHIEFSDCREHDFSRAVAMSRATFSAAVQRHLMSDVPPAAYLSAGLDSTMVAATAASMLPEPLSTFTGLFKEGGWYDEMSGARLVADRIGSDHHEVSIGAAALRENFDDMVRSLDGPRMGIGALPQYIVAAKAAKTRKMILTGHGGDELFSGYPVFKATLLARLFRKAPLTALRHLGAVRPAEIPHLVYFALRTFNRDASGGLLPLLFSRSLRRKALKPAVSKAVEQALAVKEAEAPCRPAEDGYQRAMRTYLEIYLPGLLVVEDKISMAHSLESRTPFLDNELVALSLSLDSATKLHGGELKSIMKEVAKGVLPNELFRMPKRGFPTPLNRWLRGELADWMAERIAGRNTTLTALFQRDYLDRVVHAYRSSWRRHFRILDEIQTHRMWMLLCLESWLRQYRDHIGIQLELAPAEGKR